MSTTKQKTAARKNLKKARAAGTKRKGRHVFQGRRPERGRQERSADEGLCVPDERKEPLNDAKHVRNAIARFDQVEGVTDAERAKAWTRIKKAAKKYDVDIDAKGWRDLMNGSRTSKGKRKKASRKKS